MPSHYPQRPPSPRHTSNALPRFTSASQERLHRYHQSSWLFPISMTPPGFRTRNFRFWLLNPRVLHQFTVARFGRKRGCLFLCFVLSLFCFTVFALTKRFGTPEKKWPISPFVDSSTLVYQREDLQRIWLWEIESGHYPNRIDIPEQLGLKSTPTNPALPPRRSTYIPYRTKGSTLAVTTTIGTGPKRVYLDIQSEIPSVAYPPRPVPGSVADMDIILEHCDFSKRKFVRDCLEVLRVGAGLDNGKRLRRGSMDDWKYIFLETSDTSPVSSRDFSSSSLEVPTISAAVQRQSSDSTSGLVKKRGVEWELPPINLSPVTPFRTYSDLPTPCDPDYPRVFHMFWTGPFTDKPYLALLSFLYTQNTGLHLHEYPDNAPCRSQFWMWINPGPAASVPNPSATRDMFDELRSNPWASPFLHPRFKDVIHFKLWNTTEQLDGIPEIRNEWRSLDTLFHSGGRIVNVPKKQASQDQANAGTAGTAVPVSQPDSDDLLHRAGSKSSSSYDRLSVILSDMARFILCHRFGGIYLDADTLFLRDWEELWGWRGAFAYRWSRMERYNTAVLHLNKGSALGTFLFRTALKNDLDFHPISVSRYVKDAYLDRLLLRLPDALFDSAWLNTEYYQRDRPPQPYFSDFGEFFDTPLASSAAPQALGFDGFFKGAYSYHFHNYWWKPFDPSRNWPDLGPRFFAGEQIARNAAKATSEQATDEDEDRRDLDWSAVLKRTFESYIRGERPNMYGEWIKW